MKISVCIATHNGEKYIQEQLESILKQLEANDEVVISDDSSTDETVEIIKCINDKRIRLYEKNTFFNPIFNFENALKKATGDIIVLADQDDIWLSTKVNVVRESFNGKEGRILAIVMDGYIVDEVGGILYDSIFAQKKAGKGILKNIYDNTYVGCCMAFSRELLKIALPFPKNIPMHDMWLGLLAEIFGRTAFIDEKTIKYRRHSGNVTPLNLKFDIIRQVKRRCWLINYTIARVIGHRINRLN